MNRKGYKGFEASLICRGKQYAENTIFEEKGGEICEAGMMHYCVNPFNVLDHYPLVDDKGKMNEFAEVEALDEPVTDDGKKFATKKLRVGAKLDFKGFIKACFDFVYEAVEADYSKLAASGDYSQLAASGDYSQLAASGDYSQLAASGDYSQLAASGYNSQLAASGYNSKLAASGDYSQLAASGYNSQLAASGYNSKLAASGERSVIAGIGINNIAKAAAGSWMVLAEWKRDGNEYIPVCVKAGQIDGEKLKPDTWYMLEDGEFKEVK